MEMFDSVKVGREISVQRKKMGLTQEELDVRLSISPQAVSKWGDGHVTVAISKYEEMISMCEKCLYSLSESAPETAEESREKRKMLIAVLRRSKELEMDALKEIASAIT